MNTANNPFNSIPDMMIPNAAYRPYVLHGNILHISGQLPVRDGKPVWVGQVPDAISVVEAQNAARLCTENVLAWLKHACEGDFGRVDRCLRIAGYVATGAEFKDAPAVVNAASEMMTSVLGARGEHARVALGVASLPFGAPVEIEAQFAIR